MIYGINKTNDFHAKAPSQNMPYSKHPRSEY